jgi:polysaccharide deacetylase family protein (PEP-CTERM system associated)
MMQIQENPVVNALSIDVEDYFQVSAFTPFISREEWGYTPCRVESAVDRILERLADANARATFFTLGWVAERHPLLIRRIVAAGHEIASHGYGHERASHLRRETFREDIGHAKALLEDLSGVSVKGYRAPSFSVGRHNLWAFECIAEEGYRYSSSVYPIRHDHYGMPEAPRFPYQPIDGLVEIPITTLRVFGINIPGGGGGYFRLMPYALSRWIVERVNRVEGEPAVFYFHPWELDGGQPRIRGISTKAHFRHYFNLGRMEQRLTRLLVDFAWDSMDRVFASAVE